MPPDQTHDPLEVALRSLPDRSSDEPIFRLAWHSRIFALIVSLTKEGRISWPSFQRRLIAQITQTELQITCLTPEEIDLLYFDCWLEAAQETLVAEGFILGCEIDDQIHRIHHDVEDIREGQLRRHRDSQGASNGPSAVFVSVV
jgi:nitrile hydratase accessory protein